MTDSKQSYLCSKCDCTSKSKEGQVLVFKTESVVRDYVILWEISNFHFIVKKNGEFIETSTLTTGASLDKEWGIRLYPNGSGINSLGQVGLFLHNKSKYNATVHFTFAILDSDKKECHKTNCLIKVMSPNIALGFNEFISLEKLRKEESTLLPEGRLTVQCKLRILDGIEESSSFTKTSSVDSLSEDFKKILDSSEWSDVTISVGEKKFPVHKNVLASRSPVFGAMLRNDLEESRSNIVEITDTEPDVMEEVLLYIYTGKCGRIHEMAAELIRVAEKYDLPGLKDLCDEALIEQLDVENAADMFVIADLYNRKQLKSKALNFIIKNGNEVLKSSSWKKMVASHPTLEVEVLRGMVKHHYA